jgi:hypothetical protein
VNDFSSAGIEMYRWITDLFRINRSLTGPGVVQTLGYIQKLIPDLVIQSVETGFSACGWDQMEGCLMNSLPLPRRHCHTEGARPTFMAGGAAEVGPASPALAGAGTIP